MNNVAGLSVSAAKKSSDMFFKTQYINEMTPGRGVIFATGTPVSNSMTELYTMQRYLDFNGLKEKGLESFDSWAATFGETVTSLELSAEGTGYKMRTRFARFHNLPELMTMFRSFADIQTADMLNLPVPNVEEKIVKLAPTEIQRGMVSDFVERSERISKGDVEPFIDNMLKVTTDGRKLALDQRVFDPNFPDEHDTKVNACVKNVYEVLEQTQKERSTQLIFCDLSTPKGNEVFSVYQDLKNKLVTLEVPENEIAFIQDTKNDAQKAELFAKVRNGDVRVLIGSTQMLGAGTNIQTKLVALHHLDVGWKPSDIAQREGRIVRQGNENETVEIYKYITEQTFDAYMWQILEQKQRFISQVMTSKSAERTCEDLDETVLSFAEVKALASGNPLIKEKMDLDIEVGKLLLLKRQHMEQRFKNEKNIISTLPAKVAELETVVKNIQADIELVRAAHENNRNFSMTINGLTYSDRTKAGEAIIAMKTDVPVSGKQLEIGQMNGIKLSLTYNSFYKKYRFVLHNKHHYFTDMSDSAHGNCVRLENLMNSFSELLEKEKENLNSTQYALVRAKEELNKPFTYDEELATKQSRLFELDQILHIGSNADGVIGDEKAEEVFIDTTEELEL